MQFVGNRRHWIRIGRQQAAICGQFKFAFASVDDAFAYDKGRRVNIYLEMNPVFVDGISVFALGPWHCPLNKNWQ
jgi:hypothetical protein